MRAAAGSSTIALVVGLAACAGYQENPVLTGINPEAGYRYDALERPPQNSESTFVVLTLSGGGTRAAALAYGAMKHLEGTSIGGSSKTLLDEVDVVSSVSGGSFAAAYYALSDSKAEFFAEFPDAVLHRKIQSALIWRVLAPWNWPRLLSPRFGRSDLLNHYYDKEIFLGFSYGTLPQRLPFTVLNGTDMSLGAQFPFTQEAFDRLCSDLSGVRVSRAVLSSSAFPGAFTPLTWNNYPSARCDYERPEWVDLALGNDPLCAADPTCFGDLEWSPGRFIRARVWQSYEDAGRPFIHVVDGGVSDNIGLRGPIVAMTTTDSPWNVLAKVNLQEVDRLAVIVVDAKPRSQPRRDRKASPPNVLSVLTAAASKPMANYSTDTVELVRNRFREWQNAAADYEFLRPVCHEIATRACHDSTNPWCVETTTAHCQRQLAVTDDDEPPVPGLYRVHVRFDSIRDPELRRELQRVPTNLQLPRDKVLKLIEVAGTLLEESEDYQRLKRDLALDLGESHFLDRTEEGVESGRLAYERACELGNSVACERLGAAHVTGALGTPDYSAAKTFYAAACEAGSPTACIGLGGLQAGTLLGPPDGVAATGSYLLGCELGSEIACQLMQNAGQDEPPPKTPGPEGGSTPPGNGTSSPPEEEPTPVCVGELEEQASEPFLTPANLRGVTLQLTYEATGGPCSKVVFAQTIDSSSEPIRIDTDPTITGTDSPFYNYDPKTGKTIKPRSGTLGKPGDCTGRNHATFSDTPHRYPNDATTWEVCAVCCDDGARLECRTWHYTAEPGGLLNDEGENVLGNWTIDDPTTDFSAAAKTAYKDGLTAYLKANKGMATDACVSGLSGAL